MENLENLLSHIIANPNIINNDQDFERDLKEVQSSVDQLYEDTKSLSGGKASLSLSTFLLFACFHLNCLCSILGL